MRTWVVSEDGTFEDPPLARVASLAAANESFWLDVLEPTDPLIDELAAILGLHPVAVEDAKAFDQNGTLEIYGDLAVVIGFGLDLRTNEPVEVHAFVTPTYLVTLHRAESTALDLLRSDGSMRAILGGGTDRLLHRVSSALHSDFPRCTDALDARLSDLGAEVLSSPDDGHLIEIAELNQLAARLRRTLSPGRGLAAGMMWSNALPGVSDAHSPWIRDVADDLRRIVADLEALEDRCFSMLQLHASLASNRLNASSSQLTVVATIFLPITFLVGFFGQNFEELVDTLQSGWLSFLLFGVSLNVLCVVATVLLLNRRGLRPRGFDA